VEWGLISACGDRVQSLMHMKQCKNNVPDPTGCKREGLLDSLYGDQRRGDVAGCPGGPYTRTAESQAWPCVITQYDVEEGDGKGR